MVAVTFMLQRVEIVVNGQAIADQHPGKGLSQYGQRHRRRSAFDHDVNGDFGSGKDPQPPTPPAHPPTGFIRVNPPAPPPFHSQLLLPTLHLDAHPLDPKSPTPRPEVQLQMFSPDG